MFASDSAGRSGQVYAVVGRTIFDDDPTAVDLLLGLWGGEAIYWAHERTVLAGRLRTLGNRQSSSLIFASRGTPEPVFRPVALEAFRRKVAAVARDPWRRSLFRFGRTGKHGGYLGARAL